MDSNTLGEVNFITDDMSTTANEVNLPFETVYDKALQDHPDPDQSDRSAVSWTEALAEEKKKPYFRQLLTFIQNERNEGKLIYPPNCDIFQALKLTPLERTRCVILGQDPYINPGQAHGMCFSVRDSVPFPPSLRNILRERAEDTNRPPVTSGDLSGWARQGVLLLNTILTVEAGKPLSHANLGWQLFTDEIIRTVSKHRKDVVFLLWGSPAQKKRALVDEALHLVLTAPHPSPLSASRGFFGCRHFSKTNEYLVSKGLAPIEW